jgi:hypothetical protein
MLLGIGTKADRFEDLQRAVMHFYSKAKVVTCALSELWEEHGRCQHLCVVRIGCSVRL